MPVLSPLATTQTSNLDTTRSLPCSSLGSFCSFETVRTSETDSIGSDLSDSVCSSDTECSEDLPFTDTDYESFCTAHIEKCDDDTSQNLFEPLYEGVNITVCGTFCAILEYKRACKLPFTAIEKLLELLWLVCLADNSLPKSMKILKSFFQKRSHSHTKKTFCSSCQAEIVSNEEKCTTLEWDGKDIDYLYTLQPEGDIRRIVTRK